METTKLCALALIPDCEQWPAIQAIRIANDREVHKWPPHMNVFYPFVPESDFEFVASSLAKELAQLGELRIRFSSMGNFGGTVFLKPECDEDPGLAKLHAACKAAVPDIPESRRAFVPHLTVGQFKGQARAEAFIRSQAPVSIETKISCVCLLARDSMQTPFRIPFRVLLGGGGKVERGDASPYSSDVPWQSTRCECLPACSGDAVNGIGNLTRAFSGTLARTLSGTAVKLVRSISRQGDAEPRRLLEMSDADLNERFANSRNGQFEFFTEFRFTDPAICQTIGQIQDELRQVDDSIITGQSCAPDNVHFTMNELRLQSLEDVHRVVDVLQRAVDSLVPPATAQSLDLVGVGMFAGRVLYTKPVDNDAARFLCDAFERMQSALAVSGFRPRDRGEFVAHATLCKAQGGGRFSESFLLAVEEKGYEAVKLGSQPLVEIHLCCQRHKEELTPPVIWRLLLGKS